MHRKHTTAEDGMQNARSVSHSGKTLRWYLSFRPVAIFAAAFAALLTTGLVAGSFAGVASAATPHALATSGLGYTALPTPVRIADTRAGATDPATYAGKTLAEGTGLTIDIPASANIPATASAVVVNVTAISPSGAGFLTVYPGGGTLPTAANVTYTTGQTVGDNVTVGLGPDAASGSTQSFTVYNGPATGGASVDFTADVSGYYAAGSGAGYVPIAPTRVYDSRTASGLPGAGTTLTNGGSDNVTVAGGTTGIPASATAVALNVAITNATASSFIDAYPTGAAVPGTASQNFLAGETLSSQVVAGVGTGGDVTIANHAGNVDVIVDVDGYYTTSGSGDLLTVLAAPVRLLDTRTATPPGVAGGASGTAVLSGTGAAAGVLSIADLAGSGNFLTAYASGATAPTAANVNYVPGDTYNVVENAAYAIASSSGSVSILNGPSNAATANIVVDEDGYFVAPATTFTISATPQSVPAVTVAQTANSGASFIVMTVMHLGQPVNNDTLSLSAVGSPATVCNDLNVGGASATTPTPGNTGANGEGNHFYGSSAVLGTCTITATEADYGLTATTTITQNDDNTVVFSPAGTLATPHPEAQSTAGTPNTPTFTATVTAAVTGAAVVGDNVTFTPTAVTTGGCGPTTAATAATSGTGVASFVFTAPIGTGFCSIVATEAGTAQSTSTVIDTTAFPAQTGNTVVVSPASVQVGATTPVTVTVDTAAAAPVANDPVLLSLPSPLPAYCGTLSATTATTNASGVATVTYTASANASATPCPVTAIEANIGATGTGSITQTAVNTVVVSASPAQVAEGATSAVTATVTSAAGTPVGSDDVAFVVSGGAGCGTVSSPGGFTNASGVATVTYTAGASVATCTVTATEQATAPGTASHGATTIGQIL